MPKYHPHAPPHHHHQDHQQQLNQHHQPGRENQGATPITLDPVKETSRIKKHVSSVVDRWWRKWKLLENCYSSGSPIIDYQNRQLLIARITNYWLSGSRRAESWTTSTWLLTPRRSSTRWPGRTRSMGRTTGLALRGWRWSARRSRWPPPWAPGM